MPTRPGEIARLPTAINNQDRRRDLSGQTALSPTSGGLLTLLQTKLTIPRTPGAGKALVRSRLVDLVCHSSDNRVTLICAPAGYGKTTLVLQSLVNLADDHQIAWLSLDSRDNDPTRFVSYLIGALDGINGNPGERSGAPLQLIDTDAPANQLDRLVNRLANSNVQAVLVIDDLHRIENPVIHNLLGYFVSYMPRNLRLIVTTRTEPPIPLSRIRAYGELVEIRADDLNFTAEEIALFLRSGNGGELPGGVVKQVQVRTDGWAFALHTLKGLMENENQTRQSAILDGFIGSRREVADFLLHEVLLKQSTERRDFLLRTSILPRLTGRLCDAVTGRSDGHAMLLELQREGILIFALDNHRQWYRYHHLLAELLSAQLQGEIGADGVAGLHRSASDFFQSQNMLEDATEHALAARDWDVVILLIKKLGYDPIGQRRTQTFRRWLEALPEDRLETDPLLSYWFGRSLYTMSEPKSARPHLERAGSIWEAAGEVGHLGDLLMARAWCEILEGNQEEAVELSRKSSESNRTGSPWSLAGSRYTQSVALSRIGRANEALAVFESLPDEHPHVDLVPVERGRVYALLGRFDEALKEFGRGLAVDNPTKLLVRGHIWCAEICLGLNRIEDARGHLRRVDDLARITEAPLFFPAPQLTHARFLWATGDQVAAIDLLDKAISEVVRTGNDAAVRDAEAVRAGLWIETKRYQETASWLERQSLKIEMLTAYRYFESFLVAARLHAVSGNHQEALEILTGLRTQAIADGRVIDAGRALIQEASIHQHRSDNAVASVALLQALSLLEASGHLRCFVDQGVEVEGVLRSISAAGRHVEYIARILAVTGSGLPRSDAGIDGQAQHLSPRELEVLRLVSIGLSNREISDHLFISVPTVKRHLSTIFEKFEVKSRTQAVGQARSLGLL